MSEAPGGAGAGADRPLVSVCIPTRERATWLGEALRSVYCQTLRDLEVIVFDDASEDDTLGTVARCQDPRLVYLRHEQAVGPGANRNACLAVARGRYVAWLDPDDRYLPEMLATQTAALERHPEAAMVHGAFHLVEASGRRLPDRPRLFGRDRVEPGIEAFRELSLGCHVSASTVVVRRQVYDAVGPYEASRPGAQDWEMWMRMALHGSLAYTARPMAEARWRPPAPARPANAAQDPLVLDLAAIRAVLARHGRRIPDARACARRARASLAARAVERVTDALARGDRRAAVARLMLVVRLRPGLLGRASSWLALLSAACGAEYHWHVASRAALRRLAVELEGTRTGERLSSAVASSIRWQGTLRDLAPTVRRVVPRGEAVTVIDRWDPTLLHLSRRRGWHFPDREAFPHGDPPTSMLAVAHLEDLQRRGAGYLVVPRAASWWLDHYPGLAWHLDSTGSVVWVDAQCTIYRLAGAAVQCAA
ncbi:MAG TPA: glycosyltransferase family A protein [Thermoanaerobaculia bacterium]|nr:glycosyltransferase family A protein [Thermoanaerobaculia bacterium]